MSVCAQDCASDATGRRQAGARMTRVSSDKFKTIPSQVYDLPYAERAAQQLRDFMVYYKTYTFNPLRTQNVQT